MSSRKTQTFMTVMHRASGGDDAEMTISTLDVDREGDVVEPSGALLDNYLKNPVVLFGHDHRSLPVGTATTVKIESKGIRARWRWLEGDAFAARVKNAYDQGVLRAASIGFIPKAYEPHGQGSRFTEWELLEFSLVPIPANPAAVRTLKRLGLDVDPELARASDVLKELGEMLRRGTPLSVRDMARLEAATTLLTNVRTDLETRTDEDADGDLVLHIDGRDMQLRQADLDAAIRQGVADEIAKALGRVPDPVVEFEDDVDDTNLIHLSPEDVTSLVSEAVREQFRQLTGRVD